MKHLLSQYDAHQIYALFSYSAFDHWNIFFIIISKYRVKAKATITDW